jgi:hypothetical protein
MAYGTAYGMANKARAEHIQAFGFDMVRPTESTKTIAPSWCSSKVHGSHLEVSVLSNCKNNTQIAM